MQLLYDYLLSTESYWMPSHKRNVIKIEKFLDKLTKETSMTKKQVIQKFICLSRLRTDFAKPHIYIVNAGSSGSHWLEKMLAIMTGAYNCGEVYLPTKLLSELSKIDKEMARVVVDVIYLVHSGIYDKNQITAPLINSAHITDHNKFTRYSPKSKKLLLVRDPVKIVSSRTFRKDEYKKDVAPSLNDQQYLEKNCRYVNNFFKNINPDDFDRVIKYEDLVASTEKELISIANCLGLGFDKESINSAIIKTSKSKIEQQLASGEALETNLYLGEKKDIDVQTKEYILEEVAEIRKSYGYA